MNGTRARCATAAAAPAGHRQQATRSPPTMLFTSGSFVVLVLATLAVFYLPALRRWQTATLVLSSFVFYTVNAIDAGQPGYVVLLLASIALNASASYAIYYAGTLKRARVWAVLGLVANLAILCSFKYAGLLGRSLPASV